MRREAKLQTEKRIDINSNTLIKLQKRCLQKCLKHKQFNLFAFVTDIDTHYICTTVNCHCFWEKGDSRYCHLLLIDCSGKKPDQNEHSQMHIPIFVIFTQLEGCQIRITCLKLPYLNSTQTHSKGQSLASPFV